MGFRVFNKDIREFFLRLVSETLKTREEKATYRSDMIQFLMEARKGSATSDDQNEVIDTGFATIAESDQQVKRKVQPKREITDVDITAQALVFFLAGFETVSTTMCFMAYELAVNQDIQDKLYDEIRVVTRECNGKLTYEDIMKMKYLDTVISGERYFYSINKHFPCK